MKIAESLFLPSFFTGQSFEGQCDASGGYRLWGPAFDAAVHHGGHNGHHQAVAHRGGRSGWTQSGGHPGRSSSRGHSESGLGHLTLLDRPRSHSQHVRHCLLTGECSTVNCEVWANWSGSCFTSVRSRIDDNLLTCLLSAMEITDIGETAPWTSSEKHAWKLPCRLVQEAEIRFIQMLIQNAACAVYRGYR